MNSNIKCEEEILNLKNEILKLQDEIKDLNENLFEVNEKLRESEKLKGHFISNVTNEIINPFTSVLSLAQNIKKVNGNEIHQAHHMADLIFEEAFHLDFQLKNIFAVASIEAGIESLLYTSVDLFLVSNNVKDYFLQQLTKKGINLSIHFNPEVDGDSSFEVVSDREKLEMIIKNLISNSIKYSPEGSEINLDFIKDSAVCIVEVSDHGKGIEPIARKVIFDRFKQLDEKINSINTGHGLGLSIVQAYTEMMDGEVQISDSGEPGTKIRISLPEKAFEDFGDMQDFLLDSESVF